MEKPNRLILPTTEIVEKYISATSGKINGANLHEVLMQIFMVMLNKEDIFSKALELPEFNRMIGLDCAKDNVTASIIKMATYTLAIEIHAIVESFGGYIDKEFPYMFDGFVGKDSILLHIPY